MALTTSKYLAGNEKAFSTKPEHAMRRILSTVLVPLLLGACSVQANAKNLLETAKITRTPVTHAEKAIIKYFYESKFNNRIVAELIDIKGAYTDDINQVLVCGRINNKGPNGQETAEHQIFALVNRTKSVVHSLVVFEAGTEIGAKAQTTCESIGIPN